MSCCDNVLVFDLQRASFKSRVRSALEWVCRSSASLVGGRQRPPRCLDVAFRYHYVLRVPSMACDPESFSIALSESTGKAW